MSNPSLPAQLRSLFPTVRGGAGPLLSLDYQTGWTANTAAKGQASNSVPIITSWTPRWPIKAGETYPAQPTAEQLAAAPMPTPPVPTLTARQLRLWLLSIGITPEQIDAQIAAIPDAAAQARAKVEWEYASEYRHDHPLVIQIGTALGMTQAQIDAGFRAAALL